jgi:hypothetical protein
MGAEVDRAVVRALQYGNGSHGIEVPISGDEELQQGGLTCEIQNRLKHLSLDTLYPCSKKSHFWFKSIIPDILGRFFNERAFI